MSHYQWALLLIWAGHLDGNRCEVRDRAVAMYRAWRLEASR